MAEPCDNAIVILSPVTVHVVNRTYIIHVFIGQVAQTVFRWFVVQEVIPRKRVEYVYEVPPKLYLHELLFNP